MKYNEKEYRESLIQSLIKIAPFYTREYLDSLTTIELARLFDSILKLNRRYWK